ncbi:MAG TPA: phosphoribosylanthranilate isomerase [Polyangiaceae bacterium]|nr:phosphoribosylanthranilate isomerase [Polyangiaceae bacterium]
MTAGARPWVKLCGITCTEDALAAVDAGADALGLNFVGSSKRQIDLDTALQIAEAVKGRVELVGVVANIPPKQLEALRSAALLDWLQLHGEESPATLAAVPRAFKAVAIATAADVAQADGFPGERLLVDAKVEGSSGGSGATFDWSLVMSLARHRTIILAGGLTPENVARAVRSVNPWGVDVASGIEQTGNPRRKDPEKMERFVRAARASRR